MDWRAANRKGKGAQPKPGRTLPDGAVCRGRPGDLRGFVDCLVADPGDCPHALAHADGSLCLHPAGDAIVARTAGKKLREVPKLALNAGRTAAELTFREAVEGDCRLLGGLNYELIHDLGLPHRMTISEMGQRMRRLLASDHRAMLFELSGKVVAYALYRESVHEVYLRQFLVKRNYRRRGIARRAVAVLRSRVWPRTKELTVEVLVSNRSALEFWRKVGYTDHSLRLQIPPIQPRKVKGAAHRQSL